MHDAQCLESDKRRLVFKTMICFAAHEELFLHRVSPPHPLSALLIGQTPEQKQVQPLSRSWLLKLKLRPNVSPSTSCWYDSHTSSSSLPAARLALHLILIVLLVGRWSMWRWHPVSVSGLVQHPQISHSYYCSRSSNFLSSSTVSLSFSLISSFRCLLFSMHWTQRTGLVLVLLQDDKSDRLHSSNLQPSSTLHTTNQPLNFQLLSCRLSLLWFVLTLKLHFIHFHQQIPVKSLSSHHSHWIVAEIAYFLNFCSILTNYFQVTQHNNTNLKWQMLGFRFEGIHI